MQQVLLVELRVRARAGLRQPAAVGDQRGEQRAGGRHQRGFLARRIHQPGHLLHELAQRSDRIVVFHYRSPGARPTSR
jgi:hypothetical protein